MSEVRGEELLVLAGASVAVAGSAVQSPALADERADAVAGLDQPFGAKHSDGIPQCYRADAEALRESRLGGKTVVWLEPALADLPAQLSRDL